MINSPIPVNNAGIVILNSFIPALFERLNLTNSNNFKDEESRQKAVLYLHYLVTGMQEGQEDLLSLNKLICGMAPDIILTAAITVTPAERNLIEGLITAAIGYWSSIGESSVTGFRANWLLRMGLLQEMENCWELTVEKRAYDILLNHSPFSFSVVKYPWMDKPLQIKW
ncbi:contractile injection system tape measure protein [Flavobacterium beibuense]|uniref:contractile injection system tape measure protein n=1 Tax=Flavobacterium beibuense TaxID=657326 RepID=UPI003A93FDF3